MNGKKTINHNGVKITVNFDAFNSIITKFESNIETLTNSKNYVINGVTELEENFNADTFCSIKETLSNLEISINKILENLGMLNHMIKRAKSHYEELVKLYNGNSENNRTPNVDNVNEYEARSTDDNSSTQDGKLTFNDVELRYDKKYEITSDFLTKSKGVVYFDGHKETWYSQKVLPGKGLDIPGRHVAEDGTIRDIDGYIVVASDLSYLERGSTLMTSLGPAKVYDTGCDYGTIDIYVDW